MKPLPNHGTLNIPKQPSAPRIAKNSDVRVPTVVAALKQLRKPELAAAYPFWADDDSSPPPTKVAELRQRLGRWMKDKTRVEQRVAALSARERNLLLAFVEAPECVRRSADIESTDDSDSAPRIAALERAGLLFKLEIDGGAWALPKDLPLEPDALTQRSEAQRSEAQSSETQTTSAMHAAEESLAEIASVPSDTFRALTLKGHLDARYQSPGAARPMPPARLRAQYKMYANEAQAVARVERLPEGLRDLVEKIVLEFGGLLPRRFFERMETELPHWNQRRWAKILEESLVGTVERLDFRSFGIQHEDDTLSLIHI